MKHWQVQGSMPAMIRDGHSHPWRENITAHVIADSAHRAIELVEEKHIGIEIHSVTHRGKIDVIDDRENVTA